MRQDIDKQIDMHKASF